MMELQLADRTVRLAGFRVRASFQGAVEGVAPDQVHKLQLASAKATAKQLFGGEPIIAAAPDPVPELQWLLRLGHEDRDATVICFTRRLAPDESPRAALDEALGHLRWAEIAR